SSFRVSVLVFSLSFCFTSTSPSVLFSLSLRAALPIFDRFDHVVQRQPGTGDRGQRFHLHPGAIGGAHGGGDAHFRLTQLQVHFHAADRDRVAQRDQVGSPLGRHDPRDPGGGQRVPFGQSVPLQQLHHFSGGAHHAAGHGGAGGRGLAGDVDHAGRTSGVHVGELVARHAPSLVPEPAPPSGE